MNNQIIAPAIVLLLWTLVMMFWMIGRRVTAPGEQIDMNKVPAGIRGSDMEHALPKVTVWLAHNHTHLHEQPTLFYATIAFAAIAGAASPVDVYLAWGYVALRVIHSLWQSLINAIKVRFMLHLAASLCLSALAVRVGLAICG